VLLLLFCVALGSWEKAGEAHGVVLWRRDVPGSAFKAVKGTGFVDAPLRKVALVLLDDARAPEWIDHLAEARVVRMVSSEEYIDYTRVSLPLPLSDRDFVTDVTLAIDRAAKTLLMRSVPAEDPSAPPAGAVRALLDGSFFLRAVGPDRTELTVELMSDPRGWLPAWLVNFFQKDWAVKSIDGIRAQAAKGDLRDPPAFKPLLDQLDF
jgi:hypothetical protein